ncbi:MAG: hydrolase [Acidobacteria bacterium]|nr:hydrolase [Acidobacteriota bacterium]
MSEDQSAASKTVTRHPLLATPENIGLVVVDVQEKFAPAIPGFDGIVKNVVALIKGFLEFRLPVVLTEQYPKGLGKTVREIADCLTSPDVVEKTTFSSMQAPAFADRIAGLGFKDFVVCGLEAHICVHQTVSDMLFNGYRVWVPWDATGSRDPKNRDLAMGRMEKAGAIPTSTEMHLFEMARRAGTDSFRKIQSWIK